MKTLTLAKKYLNSCHLNSAFNLVAKPQFLLHNINGSPRVIFKVKTFVSNVRLQSSLNSPAIFFGPSHLNFVSAREFRTSIIFAQSEEQKKPETLQELIETTEKKETTAVTVGQKVAQAGKDVSYFAIILAGFAVTGALLWYVLSELFLSNSPNKIYADALKKVKRNEEVIEAIGESMKAYGEETSRGRRRHVSFQEYIVNGENYMRVKFYVAGNHRKGTVHVDVKQISSRKFDYRFIFVELDGYPPRTIIIEDNR